MSVARWQKGQHQEPNFCPSKLEICQVVQRKPQVHPPPTQDATTRDHQENLNLNHQDFFIVVEEAITPNTG